MSKRVVAAMVEDIKETVTVSAAMSVLTPLFHVLAKQGAHQEHPLNDHEKINPILSIGDIRSVGGFWKAEWLVTDIVASVLARISAQICGGNVFDMIDGVEDIQLLVHSTDAVQAELVPIIMAYCTENFTDVAINTEVHDALYARYTSPTEAAAAIDEVLAQIAGRMLREVLGGVGHPDFELSEDEMREASFNAGVGSKPTLH